ncbi:MAG: bacteriocin fulvocin C-related protein [Prolixibacteraceae bacterium]
MKKLILPFLLVIFLYSCQQTELQFSCDPVIDAYVTENSEELAQLTIYETTVYELPLQRAIFASWSAEKKRSAWLEKLRYVLENESLTKAEVNHVQALIEHIVPGYFEETIILHEWETRLAFAEEWINYASTGLGWTESYIGFMVYRLYTSPSQLEAEAFGLNDLDGYTATNIEYGCACNTSDDYCQYANCQSSGCSSSGIGCGFLGMASCNGSCS